MKLSANPGKNASVRLRRGTPAWEIAHLFPLQGYWTEDDYLWLEETVGNQLVELDNGRIDVLAMPDLYHQRIVMEIFMQLDRFVDAMSIGGVYHAPLPIRLSALQYRMPDIAFFKRHRIKNKHKPPHGADLVMEIVGRGEEARERDFKIKRREYAKARIPEYWIVDPETKTIIIFALSGKIYRLPGAAFGRNQHENRKELGCFFG